MKILPSIVVAAAAVALTASAQPPAPTPGPPPPPHHGNSCFWRRDVTNFAAHDDSAVYIRVGSRRVYELKLFGNCLEMSWVHSLALRTFGDSDVCEGANPNLELFTQDIATGSQRCPVTSVRELAPQEVAALPKDARP